MCHVCREPLVSHKIGWMFSPTWWKFMKKMWKEKGKEKKKNHSEKRYPSSRPLLANTEMWCVRTFCQCQVTAGWWWEKEGGGHLNSFESQFVPQSPDTSGLDRSDGRSIHHSHRCDITRVSQFYAFPTGCRSHRTDKVSGNLWTASMSECKYLQEVEDMMDELGTEH